MQLYIVAATYFCVDGVASELLMAFQYLLVWNILKYY